MGERRTPRSHWTRQGRAKQTFKTYADAVIHAEYLLQCDLENGRFMTFPRAYECEQGGHYHVGNSH